MFSKYFLIAFLVCLDFTSSCRYNENFNTTVCASVRDAYRQGSPSWNVLKIRNFGNVTFVPLKAGTLSKCTGLTILSLHGVVNNIHKDAFQKLSKLQKVELFDNNVQSFPAELFKGLPIENVYVINSSLRQLQLGTFQRLPKLRTLFIRNNSIKVIPADVFSGSNLEELYLENNGIQVVEDFAFINMPFLTRVSLSGNNLQSFQVLPIFGSNSLNLERLWLDKNKLKYVRTDMFVHLPKLRYLFLQMNEIEEIEPGAFHGLSKLVATDISNNKLWTLPDDAFSKESCRSLEVLLLHNNRMTSIVTVFLNMPQLKYVTVFGNPLQCPCYQIIKNYFADKNITRVCANNDHEERPVCILTRDKASECVYDVEKTKYLYEDYMKLLEEWEPWEINCQFAEGYEGLAWFNPPKTK